MMRLRIGLLGYILILISCSKSEGNGVVDTDPPGYESCSFQGATEVNKGEATIEIIYDQNIVLVKPHGITLNEVLITDVKANYKKLIVDVNLDVDTEYALKIPKGVIKGPDGSTADEVVISFKTKEIASEIIDEHVVCANPSPQVVNVYNFLLENYGERCLSSTHANVSWNINEAEWVKLHTDKYPAITTVDYIHLPASPANWIDYNEIGWIEDWWNNNGLLCANWHWIVPQYEGDTDINNYTYKPEETTFRASNILVEGTWENEVAMADLAELADYLKLLQEKNIPVIWRPFHEAAGNIYEYTGGTAWFWWGDDGADTYKALWIYMFDYFESRGLNNLIWVWTTQTKDNDFYPGDEYVDIIGRDIYNNSNPSNIASQYNTIQNTYPNKMVTLSEMGAVSPVSEQWNSGARWSYFMPWYDYERTNDVNGDAFKDTKHVHANAQWWIDAMSQTYVITRDQMPSLK
nr:glycosyl hydrolase [uncultured Carboxylicivirga sp.]